MPGTTGSSMSEEERDLLRGSVRSLLEAEWPAEAYPDNVAKPERMQAVWRALCEMGLGELGGEAGGLAEAAVVLEELGRASSLAPVPAAVLVNRALGGATDPAAVELLGRIHDGSAAPVVSFGDGDGEVRFDRATLRGRVDFAEWAECATHLLAFDAGEQQVAVVELEGPGVRIEPTRALGAPGLSTVHLDGAAFHVVPVTADDIADLVRLSRIGYAARSLGATRRGFDLAVGHATQRRQFGRLIGGFQAIQHKLADSLIALDGCRLVVEHAARQYDAADPGWRFAAASAFATAASTLRQVALQTHHTLGAIGYAEEHEAPRHFKRVHVDLLRHGGVRAAQAELADHFLDGPGVFPTIDLGAAGNAFREEVDAWLTRTWTAERQAEFHTRPYKQREYDPRFAAELGETGWIGMSWPEEFGGQGRRALEQVAYLEMMEKHEAPRAGAPVQAPMLMVHGTEEQQQRYLPGILRGSMLFGMCLSEPDAGSDLASLRTAAVRDGDGWVINGQKIWTTSYLGTHLLVAARTRTDMEPRSAGISLFFVPTDAPGITIRPSTTMYDGSFANIFFDDVRVPANDLVGPEDGGWDVLMSALATERGFYGGVMVLQLMHLFEVFCAHLREQGRTDPAARAVVGNFAAQLEVGRRLMIRCAEMAEGGVTPLTEAAISKVFSGELMERFGEAALDLLGLPGTLSEDVPDAPLRGRLEQRLRYALMWVISLGTNEIQRTLIARRGLGLRS
ncbi:acyl-CoA dehydrogenase family protein [Pseudonocardia sp. CA-107938]|uniref:acyl-CoA dehydrogenase family protein n=1 Tax=Pseudonocardia sp. CA-107938 TaxID=3240021 RepID=UPI003D8DDEBF